MRFENQVLFDKGFKTLAYQLEAMMDKSPELADDFDNLVTVISDLIEDVEDREQVAYDNGYDNGRDEGYSEAQWEYEGNYSEGFEDGKAEGYEDGFEEGYEQGLEEGSQGYEHD